MRKKSKSSKVKNRQLPKTRRGYLFFLILGMLGAVIILLLLSRKNEAKIYDTNSYISKVTPSPRLSGSQSLLSRCLTDNSFTTSLTEEGPLLIYCSKLVVHLPKDAVVEGDFITMSGAKYRVYVGGMEGGDSDRCPMFEEERTQCTYDDEVLPNIDTFRVWRDNLGIFKLNPQSIKIQDLYISHFQIVKVSPSEEFAPEEVGSWRVILSNLTAI